MDFKNLGKSFKEMKLSNRTMQIANPILVVLLAGSLMVNFTKDTVVINNLNESCSVMEISRENMSTETHERLGFYLSSLLGNITPKNAEYISKSVLPFIDPVIYQQVQETLDVQIGNVINDQISIKFSPEKAKVENGKTFITGRATIIGPTGIQNKTIRTYEYQFNIQNYSPTTSYLDIYDDVPHDEEWLQKQRKHKERK